MTDLERKLSKQFAFVLTKTGWLFSDFMAQNSVANFPRLGFFKGLVYTYFVHHQVGVYWLRRGC